MAQLFSQDWLDRQRAAAAELPERPGATAVIGFKVSGGPDGTVEFHTGIEDGRIVDNGLGAHAEADFELLLKQDQYLDMLRGSLDPNVAFMQGRVKVTGNIGRMLSVLPVTRSPEWLAVSAELLDVTDGV